MSTTGKLFKAMLAMMVAAGVLFLGARATAASPPAAAPSNEAAKKPAKARTVELSVTEKGFEPTPIQVKKDEPLKLVITRKTEHTCANEIVIKDYGITQELPLNTPVEVSFTPTRSGTLKYGCGMGMMISGVLKVD